MTDQVLEEKQEVVETEEKEEKPWDTHERPDGEVEAEPDIEEEIDVDEALARAQAEYEQRGVKGKSPEAEEIERLRGEIEALKQARPNQQFKLSESTTIEELDQYIQTQIQSTVQQIMQNLELEREQAEHSKRMTMAEQDQRVEMQLKVLRDNKIVRSKEDEKAVLQTCLDYGIPDIFRAAKIWDKERKLNAMKEGGKVAQKKTIMQKMGRSTPIVDKQKLDIRKMSFDDIAAAAARR